MSSMRPIGMRYRIRVSRVDFFNPFFTEINSQRLHQSSNGKVSNKTLYMRGVARSSMVSYSRF